MNIVLVGGSGFLGRYVVRALAAEGHHSVVLTRARQQARQFLLEKNVQLRRADVHSPEALAQQFASADAVVSMAGILNESGSGGHGFNAVHVKLVEGIVDACRQAGVDRLLHVSALNAGRGDSHYLRSKGEAEKCLKASGLDVTIYQPSVIFGPGDGFFNRFGALLKFAPVLPLACPKARLQPVYAGDVARIMAATLVDHDAIGRTYQLGGPRDYSLIELVRWTASVLGLRRWVVPLPDFVARAQAALMDFVPGKPFSTDNYLSLQVDNVAPDNDIADFGFTPHSIEGVVPTYLGQSLKQQNLAAIRQRARR